MIFFESLVVLFLGLVFGSFSTALAYRVPRKLDWVAQRSLCPSCKTTLCAVDLVPVFSWLAFGGKCRTCRVSIPMRYPLTEFACAALCLLVYSRFGLSLEGLCVMVAVPFLLALLVVDLEQMILPNTLVLIIFLIGLARLGILAFEGREIEALAVNYGGGAVVFALVSWGIGWGMEMLLKRSALGFGDVKFFLAAGLWLGLQGLPYFMILSGLCGVIFALAWQKIKKDKAFPFGPSLIAALYFLLLWQGQNLV